MPHHVNAIASGKIKAHLSKTGYKSTQLMEQEADLFSSYLLMPELIVRKLYNSYRKFDPDIFEQIVEKFSVSPLASIFRVLQLDLHPMMVVRSINKQIDKVAFRSTDFYYKLNSNSDLPSDSLAANIFNSGIMSMKVKRLWVVDWFDKDSNKGMHEYCLYYPNQNTVYSVLWVD